MHIDILTWSLVRDDEAQKLKAKFQFPLKKNLCMNTLDALDKEKMQCNWVTTN